MNKGRGKEVRNWKFWAIILFELLHSQHSNWTFFDIITTISSRKIWEAFDIIISPISFQKSQFGGNSGLTISIANLFQELQSHFILLFYCITIIVTPVQQLNSRMVYHGIIIEMASHLQRLLAIKVFKTLKSLMKISYQYIINKLKHQM